MRDVVLYQLLSLDGVSEEPGDWFADGGPEVFDNLSRVIATQTDVLLGRATYDYWVEYWPTSDVEPFATFINTTPKHVATSSPLTSEWGGSRAVSGSVVDHVRALKAGDGGDIGIHGSATLAAGLLGAGLVDRLELVVAPAIAGGGDRLFEGVTPPADLALEAESRSPAGTLFLSYRVAPPEPS